MQNRKLAMRGWKLVIKNCQKGQRSEINMNKTKAVAKVSLYYLSNTWKSPVYDYDKRSMKAI